MGTWGGCRALRVLAAATAAAGLLAVSAPAALAGPGDLGVEGPSFSGANAGVPPSGSKPESKLWWNDGAWWGSLFDSVSGDFHIFRFDVQTQAWTDTGVPIDSRNNSIQDTLWDGTRLYVSSHVYSESPSSGKPSSLYRYSYDGAADTYVLDPGFPAQINDLATETLVIAKDSTGQLWATWTAGGQVWVNRTSCTPACDDASWGSPFALASGLYSDDVSSLIAFGGSRIGVMWSNQNTDTMAFRSRLDTDIDTTWAAPETAYAGPNLADDHMNLKTDPAGRIYAAVKTSRSSSADVLTHLLVRSPEGMWVSHRFGLVSDSHTRPIVVLDTVNGLIRMFASVTQSGGTIYEKSIAMVDADAAGVDFPAGVGEARIRDAAAMKMNNATSTKQNLDASTGLLVLATNKATKRYWSYSVELGVDTTPPTLQSVVADGTAQATTGAVALTYDEALNAATAPAAGAFTVTGSLSGPLPVLGATVSGSTVSLVLGTQPRPAESLTLSYEPPPTGAIEDVIGNDAAAVTGLAVTNGTTPPALQAASATGSSLVLAYDEALNAASVPLPGTFAVTGSGSGPLAVSAVSVSGSSVALTLTAPVLPDETVTLDYAPPATGPIEDDAGNDAGTLAGQAVANDTVVDTVSPALQAARVDATTLTLAYDELLSTAPPDPSAFSVSGSVQGGQVVTGVAIAGPVVSLTLTPGVAAGEIVVLDYVPPASSPLEDPAGNDAAALAGQAVANDTVAPGGQLVLLPNGDAARDAAIRDQGGGSADLWDRIDDGIATADNGTGYVRNDNRTSGSYEAELSGTPAQLTRMLTLSVSVRARTTGRLDDVTTLYAQVVEADGTPLTGEVVVAANPGLAAWTTLTGVPLTILGDVGKTAWDAARLRLRWAYEPVGTPDRTQARVTAVELNGTWG
ncbi:MAG: SwmB domain-containing protein [Gaiellales bacterium]